MKSRQKKKNARPCRGQLGMLVRRDVTRLCNSLQMQLDAIEAWMDFEEACEADEARRLKNREGER